MVACLLCVACNEPSRLQPGTGIFLLIAVEEVGQQLESQEDRTLLFPPKGLVMALCGRLSADKTLGVVMQTTNYTSMVEMVVKIQDCIGDKDRHLSSDIVCCQAQPEGKRLLFWFISLSCSIKYNQSSMYIGRKMLFGMTSCFQLVYCRNTKLLLPCSHNAV